MKIKYLLAVLLLIAGCKTSPPTNPILVPSGKVFVSSNIDSAKIFLDGSFTGKFTPDTISASLGEHIILLEKEGFISGTSVVKVGEGTFQSINITLSTQQLQKVVLIEDFANVSCVPCVTSNKILHSFSIQYGSEKLLIIKFPTNFPSPNDPFYKANPQQCNNRIGYYNILAAPTTIVDGILRPNSTDSIKIKEKIEERLLLPSQFKLTVKDSLSAGSLIADVKVELINNSGLNFQNLTAQIVVVEKKIEFSTPPGSNGEIVFYDVMREMIPTVNGVSLSSLQNSNEIEFSYSVPLNNNWNSSEIGIIVFIQDKTSKEVYQAKSTF